MFNRLPLPVLWGAVYVIVLTTPFNPFLTSPGAAIAYVALIVAAHGFLLYQQSEKDLAERGQQQANG